MKIKHMIEDSTDKRQYTELETKNTVCVVNKSLGQGQWKCFHQYFI